MFHGKRRRKPNAKPSVSSFAPTTYPSYHAVNAPGPLLNTHPNSSIYNLPPHHIIPQPHYDGPPPLPPRPPRVTTTITRNTRLKDWKALPGAALSTGGNSWPIGNHIDYGLQLPEESVVDEALCNLISEKFDTVITSIDGEAFAGNLQELEIDQDAPSGIRGGWGVTSREVSRGANRAISTAVVSTNYFAKVDLYANSRLPSHLPPLKLYFPSYPLLCLAAQYSLRAYLKPAGDEREDFVNSDWRMGTKAMVMKSLPIDDMNCVVFAIRGSQTFMDWAVNLKSEPVAPVDFLDDPGNLSHQGYLSVARKMVKPVAARLRSLLEENPSRSSFSLLITGHSAGGAVASLLYAHMLAEDVKSELNILTGCFKRIHCLTFGTPPISLLPISKPNTLRHKKSLFMSFINEGDPVPRADKSYTRSLLRLYASPAPGTKCIASIPVLKPSKPKIFQSNNSALTAPSARYIWKLPPGALSNAGRLVVLRANPTDEDDVKAEITSDEQLRSVVFGDPVMHMMKIYARRVEVLATKAVTAQIRG